MLCLQVLVQLVKTAKIVRSDVMIGVRISDSPFFVCKFKRILSFRLSIKNIYNFNVDLSYIFYTNKNHFFLLGLILMLVLGLTLCWAGPVPCSLYQGFIYV
jgi:hypothetical protein